MITDMIALDRKYTNDYNLINSQYIFSTKGDNTMNEEVEKLLESKEQYVQAIKSMEVEMDTMIEPVGRGMKLKEIMYARSNLLFTETMLAKIEKDNQEAARKAELAPDIEQQNDDVTESLIFKEMIRQAKIGRAYPQELVWEYIDAALRTVKNWLAANDAPPDVAELLENLTILQMIVDHVGCMDATMACSLAEVMRNTRKLFEGPESNRPEYLEYPGVLDSI